MKPWLTSRLFSDEHGDRPRVGPHWWTSMVYYILNILGHVLTFLGFLWGLRAWAAAKAKKEADFTLAQNRLFDDLLKYRCKLGALKHRPGFDAEKAELRARLATTRSTLLKMGVTISSLDEPPSPSSIPLPPSPFLLLSPDLDLSPLEPIGEPSASWLRRRKRDA